MRQRIGKTNARMTIEDIARHSGKSLKLNDLFTRQSRAKLLHSDQSLPCRVYLSTAGAKLAGIIVSVVGLSARE